jgi:3-methyladenine DNA glycosylase AlkD
MVDDPKSVTEAQMEQWVRDFDSWDVCDTCCGYLFDKTPISYRKALEWTERAEEYVKRAGFALIAYLAVHDKKAPDARFIEFLPAIKREATDGRNFVKKAVNWALRQIGKRNKRLNEAAIEAAHTIAALDSGSARWVASDALRELTGDAVQRRLQARAS